MATVTSETFRATYSRKAKDFANQDFKTIEKIHVSERAAPVSDGWVKMPYPINIEYVDNYVQEIWFKTATLGGASALYARPSTGDNVRFWMGETNLMKVWYEEKAVSVVDEQRPDHSIDFRILVPRVGNVRACICRSEFHDDNMVVFRNYTPGIKESFDMGYSARAAHEWLETQVENANPENWK